MSKTDERKIALAVIGREATPSEAEIRAELNAMTAEDYDDWFLRALDDRKHGKVQMDPTGSFRNIPLVGFSESASKASGLVSPVKRF